MCCWNVAKYKWRIHNGKMEIISFVLKFHFKLGLAVIFYVYVKVYNRSSCI